MTINLPDWTTVLGFTVSLITLIFHATRWLKIKESELKTVRFITYHKLLHAISTGQSEEGPMKLVCQLAYIYELRNFSEYALLTKSTLGHLRKDWQIKESDDMKRDLIKAADETMASLERSN